MGFRIREIDAECKFSSALTVEALSRAIPPDAITRALAQEAANHQRQRKLTMPVVVWLIIVLHLYTTLSIGAVLIKLARGLRFIWPDPTIRLPKTVRSAIAAASWAHGRWWRCFTQSASRLPRPRRA